MSRRSTSTPLAAVTSPPTIGPAPRRTVSDRGVVARSAAGVAEGTNIVILRGRLSRMPEHRVLASGSVLLTADLTICPIEGSSETVPVVWFDPPAQALRLDDGDDVVAIGRVRRRFFRSAGATLSRTEVVASSITTARSSARIRAAVAAALDPITPSE